MFLFESRHLDSYKIKMVAVRKNLDLVWVWFDKNVAPTALFKDANLAK